MPSNLLLCQIKWQHFLIITNFFAESFSVNCFEQLCFNYSNEVLRKLFTDHILKRQAELHRFEGLKGQEVKFAENENILGNIKVTIFLFRN